MKKTSFLLSVLIGVLTLSITGCDGGGGSGSDTPTGPASSSSFSGTSITFNPTVNFLAGNSFTYVNTDTRSTFPMTEIPVPGTYTYVPNSSYTAGVLTLTFDGPGDPLVLELSDFVRSGNNVVRFTARYQSRSYTVNVSGQLPAYVPGQEPPSNTGETSATDVPAALRGARATTFDKTGDLDPEGLPEDGASRTFTIGARTLAFDGRTLSDPVFIGTNTDEWIFKDGEVWYVVTQTSAGQLNNILAQAPILNEIRVLYGTFTPTGGGDGGNGGNNGGNNGGVDNDGVTVDNTGKFAAGSTFTANLSSQNTSNTGDVFTDVPVLGDNTQFTVSNAGGLVITTGGETPGSVTLPFFAVSSSNVTYRLTEAGTPAKTYTVVVNKNASNNPSTISAEFTHTEGTRNTTRTYQLLTTSP